MTSRSFKLKTLLQRFSVSATALKMSVWQLMSVLIRSSASTTMSARRYFSTIIWESIRTRTQTRIGGSSSTTLRWFGSDVLTGSSSSRRCTSTMASRWNPIELLPTQAATTMINQMRPATRTATRTAATDWRATSSSKRGTGSRISPMAGRSDSRPAGRRALTPFTRALHPWSRAFRRVAKVEARSLREDEDDYALWLRRAAWNEETFIDI